MSADGNSDNNPSTLSERALRYHSHPKPGKLETGITKPAGNADDLSLAYSPGVASPCLEIEKDPELAYQYTGKGNLVGVISNGTAVLGLGDIGALASKPVMEGKAMLFKRFAGVDAYDIEINAPSPEVFIETVANIAPTFGAINLEDIRAPECFFIEHRLRRRLDIPIMHDDQHGTAVVTCAALLNALELQNKKPENIRVLVLGAGAAAVAITRLAMNIFGLKKRQILMFDSKGLLTTERCSTLESYKMSFVRDTRIKSLESAVRSSDVIIGVSRGDLIKPEWLKKMRDRPIIMAMANPIPEIMPAVAKAVRDDVIIATGRSDLPNQVNNSVCFPYLFRAALDIRAKKFNSLMFKGAVESIAALAREPVPAEVLEASGVAGQASEFGPDYILPKQFDPRLRERVVPAIIAASQKTVDPTAAVFDAGIQAE
ncbi:MAG: malate dehydrogenase [Proteobacteria bacterium]|nr:malate dehydrogenase [Pseudomonadota bacterium]